MAEQIYRIKLRRDTTTNWETNNPILESGEIGIDLTLNRFKIGIGTTWNETEWFAYSISELEEVTQGDIQNALADYYTETEIDGLLEGVLLQIPTNVSQLTNDIGYITSVSWNEVTDKPTFATVATTGDYDDLLNKPSIPTVPTNVSSFTNDAGYITNAVSDLLNYYTKTDVNTLIGQISTLHLQVVETLPVSDISTNTIYLVPKQDAETDNIYDEFIYVNNVWEYIGSTETDLTDYYTKSEVDTIVANITIDWTDVQNKPTLATVATTGNYDDLTNKPTIPVVPDYVVTGQTMSYQIWTGTQTEYDNLQEYSATTLYFIKETVL